MERGMKHTHRGYWLLLLYLLPIPNAKTLNITLGLDLLDVGDLEIEQGAHYSAKFVV